MGSGKGANKRIRKTIEFDRNAKTIRKGNCVTLVQDDDSHNKHFKMNSVNDFAFEGDLIMLNSEWKIEYCYIRHAAKQQTFYINSNKILASAKDFIDNPEKYQDGFSATAKSRGVLQWHHLDNTSTLFFHTLSIDGNEYLEEIATMPYDDFQDIQKSIITLCDDAADPLINKHLLKKVVNQDVNF